ncbi:hypothetical protein 1 [Hubei tombus-like virus 39]|uniref:hypothetical protein 1 n=1 Tax=Hubei tombus-like virus 39 TaxID=1923287 RepID=UPI00090B63F4|nr:hypothetical protein 1 [Hubei tombus-like virus 39]APG76482.1 hypothetical protein 1 [Hubei tombus-like virus 39]
MASKLISELRSSLESTVGLHEIGEITGGILEAEGLPADTVAEKISSLASLLGDDCGVNRVISCVMDCVVYVYGTVRQVLVWFGGQGMKGLRWVVSLVYRTPLGTLADAIRDAWLYLSDATLGLLRVLGVLKAVGTASRVTTGAVCYCSKAVGDVAMGASNYICEFAKYIPLTTEINVLMAEAAPYMTVSVKEVVVNTVSGLKANFGKKIMFFDGLHSGFFGIASLPANYVTDFWGVVRTTYTTVMFVVSAGLYVASKLLLIPRVGTPLVIVMGLCATRMIQAIGWGPSFGYKRLKGPKSVVSGWRNQGAVAYGLAYTTWTIKLLWNKVSTLLRLEKFSQMSLDTSVDDYFIVVPAWFIPRGPTIGRPVKSKLVQFLEIEHPWRDYKPDNSNPHSKLAYERRECERAAMMALRKFGARRIRDVGGSLMRNYRRPYVHVCLPVDAENAVRKAELDGHYNDICERLATIQDGGQTTSIVNNRVVPDDPDRLLAEARMIEHFKHFQVGHHKVHECRDECDAVYMGYSDFYLSAYDIADFAFDDTTAFGIMATFDFSNYPIGFQDECKLEYTDKGVEMTTLGGRRYKHDFWCWSDESYILGRKRCVVARKLRSFGSTQLYYLFPVYEVAFTRSIPILKSHSMRVKECAALVRMLPDNVKLCDGKLCGESPDLAIHWRVPVGLVEGVALRLVNNRACDYEKMGITLVRAALRDAGCNEAATMVVLELVVARAVAMRREMESGFKSVDKAEKFFQVREIHGLLRAILLPAVVVITMVWFGPRYKPSEYKTGPSFVYDPPVLFERRVDYSEEFVKAAAAVTRMTPVITEVVHEGLGMAPETIPPVVIRDARDVFEEVAREMPISGAQQLDLRDAEEAFILQEYRDEPDDESQSQDGEQSVSSSHSSNSSLSLSITSPDEFANTSGPSPGSGMANTTPTSEYDDMIAWYYTGRSRRSNSMPVAGQRIREVADMFPSEPILHTISNETQPATTGALVSGLERIQCYRPMGPNFSTPQPGPTSDLSSNSSSEPLAPALSRQVDQMGTATYPAFPGSVGGSKGSSTDSRVAPVPELQSAKLAPIGPKYLPDPDRHKAGKPQKPVNFEDSQSSPATEDSPYVKGHVLGRVENFLKSENMAVEGKPAAKNAAVNTLSQPAVERLFPMEGNQATTRPSPRGSGRGTTSEQCSERPNITADTRGQQVESTRTRSANSTETNQTPEISSSPSSAMVRSTQQASGSSASSPQ